jgi:hypothetical protein
VEAAGCTLLEATSVKDYFLKVPVVEQPKIRNGRKKRPEPRHRNVSRVDVKRQYLFQWALKKKQERM